MSRLWAIVVATTLVAGCGATSNVKEAAAPITLAAAVRGSAISTPPKNDALVALEAVSDAPPPIAPAPKLLCDAPSLSYLIGHSRSEIPVPADLSHRRVVCATCPGNIDYRPDRTNILFNASTGIVTAVKCG
jgi:hypothetical protein